MKTLLSLAATTLFGVCASTAVAGDPEKGAMVFKKCKACHAVGDGAKNKVGPQLNNIVGNAAGAVGGYKYSKARGAQGEAGRSGKEAAREVHFKYRCPCKHR